MGYVVARPAIAGEVWLDIQELALRLRRAGIKVDGSQLVELGARIVIELARTGRLGDELEAEVARLREALSEATAKAEARQ